MATTGHPRGFSAILSGYFFDNLLGSVLIIFSATDGALLLVLTVSTLFGEVFQKKGAKWVNKFNHGFKAHAFNDILMLRFIPIFPFWTVNLVAGIMKINWRVFTLATIIGIIPGTVIYVAVGHSLDTIFETDNTFDYSILFSPSIVYPLQGWPSCRYYL